MRMPVECLQTMRTAEGTMRMPAEWPEQDVFVLLNRAIGTRSRQPAIFKVIGPTVHQVLRKIS